MSDRTSRWPLAILPFVMIMTTLPIFVRHRGIAAAIWPAWHVQIEQAVLFFALVCLAVAIVGGVMAWRRETRRQRDIS
jgi:hypothetical protein